MKELKKENLPNPLLRHFSNCPFETYLIETDTLYFVKEILWNIIIPKSEKTIIDSQIDTISYSDWLHNNLDAPSELKQYQLAGRIYLLAGQFKDSNLCLQRAFKIIDNAENHHEIVAMKLSLGLHLYLKAEYEEALSIFQAAYDEATSINCNELQMQSLKFIAKVSSAKGDFNNARRTYMHILEHYEATQDKSGTAGMLNNVAIMELSEGCYNEALDKLLKAQKMAKELGEQALYVSSTSNLGLLYSLVGGHQLAVEEYQEALKVSRIIGDLYGVSQGLYALGNLYSKCKKYEVARSYYFEAVEIDDRLIANNIRVQHLRGLAKAEFELGNKDNAFNYIESAISLAKKINDAEELNLSVGCISWFYEVSGRYDEAIPFLKQQIEISLRQKYVDKLIIAYDSLGRIYCAKGNLREAVLNYEKALKVAEQESRCKDKYLVLNHIGMCYYKNKDYVKAYALYKKIYTIAQSSNNHSWIRQAKIDIETIQRKMGMRGNAGYP